MLLLITGWAYRCLDEKTTARANLFRTLLPRTDGRTRQDETPQPVGLRYDRENSSRRFTALFADIRRGEGITVILLMLNLFVLLTAYLIIKTVREPLILVSGGAEVKSYAAAGHVLLLLLILPIYGLIAGQVNRIKLINYVTLFFVSNLILFYTAAQFDVALGVVFFLWAGIANLLLIAQFWSFANDVYTYQQGQRLFAIIALGASLGAILGAVLSSWLFAALGPYKLMLVAAGLLVTSVVIANIIHCREVRPDCARKKSQAAEVPASNGTGLGLIFGHRYLLLIALLMVVVNVVNTTGEFILSKTVTEGAQSAVAEEEWQLLAAGQERLTTLEREKFAHDFVAKFYGTFFLWIGFSEALIQLFLVSRIFKHLGVSGALFFPPMIAFGSYFLLAFMPVPSYIRFAKIVENTVNYSLQNTVRHALFLPTTREAKYTAKAAIDTLFVRIGDVLSAAIVLAGSYLVFDTQTFAMINTILVISWLALVTIIGRYYKDLTRAKLTSPQEVYRPTEVARATPPL
jgi:ATP:ADP antiporter, AAA family